MAVVDRASFLIDTMALRLRPLRDGLFLAGLYITSKWSYKVISSMFQSFHIYVLPRFYPRDFVEEYGEWAIVTGASRGIGKSYAHELAKRGLNLVLVARNKSLLDEVAEDIHEKYKVQVQVVIADLSLKENFEKVKESLEGKDIGILVNNAGVNGEINYFGRMPPEDFERIIMVNIFALTSLTNMVLPQMEAKGKGAIVNIASLASLVPHPLISVYSGSKAYVNFFSRAVQAEYASKNITIQCLTTGGVKTDMMQLDVKDSPGILDPNEYAASAVCTLGFTTYTCGHWSHSLQANFALPFVTPFLMYLFLKKVAGVK